MQIRVKVGRKGGRKEGKKRRREGGKAGEIRVDQDVVSECIFVWQKKIKPERNGRKVGKFFLFFSYDFS